MIGGIGVLAVFAVFAVMMYRRVMPAIVALPCMAVVMMLVAGVPLARIGSVAVDGSVQLAPVIVTVVLGALLARVTMDTGIARALVNLAAEYGGERPALLALALCAVVAVLFTSLSGLGAIIMVGSIVLPVMMTTGVPRAIAATLFMMAFALGFIFNLANWRFYTLLFGVVPGQLVHYAIFLAIVDAAALVIYAAVSFRRERGYATWAVAAQREPSRIPAIALITPVLPIVLYFALHVDPSIAFVLSALFGAVVTRGRRSVETLTAAAIRGVEDVAPAVLLFMGIGVLLAATKEPAFGRAIEPLVSAWAGNWIAYVVLFGLCSPLVLYRGPLNPFGVGIAVFTVLLTTHAFAPVVLVAAVMAVVQVQNVCDPTNTANVWVANFTGTPIDVITKRTLPYQTAVATIGVLAVALVRPVQAATLPGLAAPPASAQRIGVEAQAGSSLARAAAAQAMSDLNRSPWTAFPASGDPDASDCTRKPYAALVYVTASTFALTEGTDLDVGLRLEDCGGWIIDEWHDHKIEPSVPGDADARALADEGAARLVAWAAHDPRSPSLFATGVPVAPGAEIPYFYAIFKTVDGNMRAYVRAGGPAYAAGLRTGDVIEKIDGHFWWEYGTYQTELRAYDGKPHEFEIQRGNQTFDVTLGER